VVPRYVFVIDRTSCGDGVVKLGEECEPPGTATCDAFCQRIPNCSDGFVDLPETCDDGNNLGGDGCPADCRPAVDEIEPNHDGPADVGGGVDGNDCSAGNAQGPFSSDTIIHGVLSPAGDEDVFAIHNPSGSNTTYVRLDIYDAALGVGVPCRYRE